MALAGAQKRLDQAKYFGEGLMREYLSLLIDSQAAVEKASLAFGYHPQVGLREGLERTVEWFRGTGCSVLHPPGSPMLGPSAEGRRLTPMLTQGALTQFFKGKIEP